MRSPSRWAHVRTQSSVSPCPLQIHRELNSCKTQAHFFSQPNERGKKCSVLANFSLKILWLKIQFEQCTDPARDISLPGRCSQRDFFFSFWTFSLFHRKDHSGSRRFFFFFLYFVLFSSRCHKRPFLSPAMLNATWMPFFGILEFCAASLSPKGCTNHSNISIITLEIDTTSSHQMHHSGRPIAELGKVLQCLNSLLWLWCLIWLCSTQHVRHHSLGWMSCIVWLRLYCKVM